MSEVTELEGAQEAESPLAALRARRKAAYDAVTPMITARRAERAAFTERRDAEAEAERPSQEERDAYDAAEEAFNESVAARLSEVRQLDAQIEQEEAVERSLEAAQRASRMDPAGTVQITHQPLTYREDNQRERSYFLDLAAMQIPEVRARASARLDGFAERLDTHSKEIQDILPKRWQAANRRADDQVDAADRDVRKRVKAKGYLEESPFHRSARMQVDAGEESRAPSRIVGQGGYAVPPLWLMDEYIPYLRPGRVAAGMARNLTLPEGTDSINIPRLTTPTLTAIQTADAAPVASRDIQDSYQQANVKTIAGQEDVPIQLIEQSPGQILDRVLMTDLIADYNQKVDLQVIQGNGTGAPLSGGQVVGLYPSTNWSATSLTWTNSAPYPNEFFQVLGAMASKTAYNRFNLRDFAFLMHPRRWFWGATGLDGASGLSGKPLVNVDSPYNVTAMREDPTPFEGLAGVVPFGPRAYIDANVPTTDGSTGDIVVGAIWDDLWLFEGDLRTRVLSEVLSGTLELRFQVYGYLAFLARYGQSITIGSGTGFAPPYTMSGSSNGVAF